MEIKVRTQEVIEAQARIAELRLAGRKKAKLAVRGLTLGIQAADLRKPINVLLDERNGQIELVADWADIQACAVEDAIVSGVHDGGHAVGGLEHGGAVENRAVGQDQPASEIESHAPPHRRRYAQGCPLSRRPGQHARR